MDENEGLIIAEVELASEDQELRKPHWVGNEITDDSRFYNANLVAHPYSEWRDVPMRKSQVWQQEETPWHSAYAENNLSNAVYA